jgi:hypothetical protein
MMAFKTAKTKRSFTYSAVVLLVISIFILTYWYYFIPNNRKTIHKNGFLILKTIADNIEDLAESRVSLYQNFYKNALSADDRQNKQKKEAKEKIIRGLFKENKIDATVELTEEKAKPTNSVEVRIEQAKLIISLFNDSLKEKVEFTENNNPLLETILSTQRSELFRYYLLGKMKDSVTELLYCNNELAIRSDKGIDSLLPKGEEGYLTGIRELNLHDVNQIVFYYPFRVKNTQLIIGGFVDAKEYNAALRNVPFYFLYPLVIIFLLLLVLLPIIKFYVMDPNEQVRIRDVILFGLSAFTAASFITLMIIHYYLWKGEEYRVRQKLATLSGQIAKSFTSEIRRSYEQLTILDNYKNKHRPQKAKQFDYSDTIIQFIKKDSTDPTRYFYFDRISWIDSSGEQKIKADLYSKPVFANIEKRKYFDVFKKGAPYSLPGDRDIKIGLEAIFSITNAEFNITISRKDTAAGGNIIAMALQPNSVLNSILPSGYGFCIIDENGNVQVHSDINRNLNENFFQKIEPAGDVTSAVMTRQVKQVNDVVAYGKTNQMLVLPIDNLPFYLITFYDKGFIYPVNMRILVFSLAFCFFSFLTCMVLWWILVSKFKTAHQLVYCRLDAISWLIPRPTEAAYYIHACCFLVCYVVTLVLYVFLHKHYEINNFNILIFLMITPVNIAVSLSTMRIAFIRSLEGKLLKDISKEETLKERIKKWTKEKTPSLINIGIHLAISLFIYYFTYGNFPITKGFLFCQLVINGILWLYTLPKSSSNLFKIGSKRSFLGGYTWLASLIVLALAVLPSGLYTWYAHNQEIIQSVKRQQLHLARAISDRNYILQQMKGINSTKLPIPDFYLDSMQFKTGIYTIYHDSVANPNRIDIPEKDTLTFDNFYFSIAEKVSTPYYKQQPYAVLTDTAYDKSWYWKRKDSFIYFSYYPALPALKTSNTENRKMLTIQSTIPSRFIFLNLLKSFIPLSVAIALLIWALYAWLRINLHQIFLVRHIHGKKNNPVSTGAYADDANCLNRERIYQLEEKIVDDIGNSKWLYSERWEKCSEKEKFLLFNIARDGLINHKNTMEIIALLKKRLLVIDNDRIKPFEPAFRAYILSVCTEDNADMARIQKKYLENSSWNQIRMPLIILLIGIAVIIFFTQQYIFDKLLLLAGGIGTLAPLIISVLGGSNKQQVNAKT